jgi:hypothetical protein
VRTVIPTADRQKATVKVRISTDDGHVHLIDPATQPRILPDMGVKVTFLEEEKPKAAADKPAAAPAVALVPQAAVHQDNSSKFVFLVKGDTLERRRGFAGFQSRDGCRNSAGLQPDTVIVAKGPEGLRDGQSVQIKPQ